MLNKIVPIITLIAGGWCASVSCADDKGDKTSEQAKAICERLRVQFDKHLWRPLARGLHVTGTIGVADSREAKSAIDLLRVADSRLYQAKQGRRSRVARAGPRENLVSVPALPVRTIKE